MSLIKQTETKTTPGTYTYTIPAGVSSIQLALWGGGGASGSNGPATEVQVGSTSTTVQAGTQQVQTGTTTVQTGTTRVQIGTRQVQVGTERVQVGTRQEAYQVATTSSKGSPGQAAFVSGTSVGNNGKSTTTSYTTAYRTVPVYETRPIFVTEPVYADQPVFGSQPVYSTQPVITTITNPIFETRAGGAGGGGGGGGYASKKIKVAEGDVLEISVGGPGQSYVGGFGLELTAGSAKPLVELTMNGENYIDPFKTVAGAGNDICVAVIDEVSPDQSEINASWAAFRAQWPTRKFYLLDPTTGTAGDNIKLPTGYTSDPNAFGPFKVARDRGNDAVATKWYDLVDAASLPSGASVRLSIDNSGSMIDSGVSCVKASRELFIRDLNTNNGVNYRGGNAGAPTNGGRGGGGGGATVARLNGNIILVAAGGGGGGGGGITSQSGLPGIAAVNTGIGSGDQGQGKFSSAGAATGGGGGGGWFSGLAGSSGSVGGAGRGGVNYGTLIEAGSGRLPGGRSDALYPGNNVGVAGFAGAAVIAFIKTFNIRVKRTGLWNFIDRGWVKVNGEWKEINNGWVKVSGQWYPLITSRSVEGAESTAPATITYSLAANRANVSEGNAVSFTVTTTGVANGTQLPYTATGISNTDLTVGSTSGTFTVGSSETITFVPRQNLTTNGNRVLRVIIPNTEAVASTLVLDTSQTPIYTLSSNVSSINEGRAVRFTMSSVNAPNGDVVSYSVDGISASRLSPGSDPLQGTFTVGSDTTADIAVRENLLTDGNVTMTMRLLGKNASASVSVIDTSRTPSGNITFTSSDSWTVPLGISTINVEILGGGGGGGGGHGTNGGGCGNSAHVGGRGGGGEKKTFTQAVTGGQSISFIVGTGGAGGGGNTNGSNGVATVFLSTNARGGGGGIRGTGDGKGASGTDYGGGNGGLGGAAKGGLGTAGKSGYVKISWGE